MREWLHSWRPTTVTGGASTFPLLVLFGLNAVDELDRSVFQVLVPEIRDAFDLDNQGILTIVSVVYLLAILSQPLVGYFGDRRSRVRIALGGAFVWGLFTLVTGAAVSVGMLIFARCLTSVGRGVSEPTHFSLLADYYPPDTRVRVYGFHRAANSLGQVIGPLLGGGLAVLFGWRAPFLLFWLPTLLIVFVALPRLRDPARGQHERRAAGGSDELVATEEKPGSWREAWRACREVRTLRRIWLALPFIAVAFAGVASVFNIAYEELYELDEFERGVVSAASEPFELVGIALIIPWAARVAARGGTQRLFRLLLVVGGVAAVGFTGFALAPNVWFAVVMHVAVIATAIPVIPVLFSILSLVLPPRARSFGVSITLFYLIPGLAILPIVGAVADAVGVRAGIVVLVPVFMLGTWIISTAGRFVEEDIARVRTASLATVEASLRQP